MKKTKLIIVLICAVCSLTLFFGYFFGSPFRMEEAKNITVQKFTTRFGELCEVSETHFDFITREYTVTVSSLSSSKKFETKISYSNFEISSVKTNMLAQ